MSDSIKIVRQQIAELGLALYQRKLTDAAGGNISARVGDVLVITPRYAGSKYRWRIQPEQVLVLDLEGNKLEGEGEISREVKVHCKLLNEFYPTGTAVIHAHPLNVLVFCAAEKPIPPVLEGTQKFGEIKHVPAAPAHSQELADGIAALLQGQEERIKKQAAAALAPRHGIFVLGKDLPAAFDAVERIDGNAYCILFSKMLSHS
ncbi:MAG TPA: class II aldolase/adducin family protein [Anaerolineae bacterium]|nr:class II aldolase/adducin family protein [Anaerolineae bacterium]